MLKECIPNLILQIPFNSIEKSSLLKRGSYFDVKRIEAQFSSNSIFLGASCNGLNAKEQNL